MDVQLEPGDNAEKMNKFRSISDFYGISHHPRSLIRRSWLRRAIFDLRMRLEWLWIDIKVIEILNLCSPYTEILHIYLDQDGLQDQDVIGNLLKTLRRTAMNVNCLVFYGNHEGRGRPLFSDWIMQKVWPALTGRTVGEVDSKVNVSWIKFRRVKNPQTSREATQWKVTDYRVQAELGSEAAWNPLRNLLAASSSIRTLKLIHERPEGESTGLVLPDFAQVSLFSKS